MARLRGPVSVERVSPAGLLPGAEAWVTTDRAAVLFRRDPRGLLAVVSPPGEARWTGWRGAEEVRCGLPLPGGLAPGTVKTVELGFDLGRYAREFPAAALPVSADLDSQVAAGLFAELAGGEAEFARVPPGVEVSGMVNLDVSSGAVGARQAVRFDGSALVVDHHFSRGERSALEVLDREFRGLEVPGQALELAHTEAEHRALVSGDTALGLVPFLEPRLVLALAREGALLEPLSRFRDLGAWAGPLERARAAREAALAAPVFQVAGVPLVEAGAAVAGFARGAQAVVECFERGGRVYLWARSAPGRALPRELLRALGSLPGAVVAPGSGFAACAGPGGGGLRATLEEVAARLGRHIEGRGLERGPALELGRDF